MEQWVESILISASTGFLRQGIVTDGTTDGNTYTLSGVNLAVCADNQGNLPVAPMTIRAYPKNR